MQRSDGSFQKRMRRWESGPTTRFLTCSCHRRLQLFTPDVCDHFAATLALCRTKYNFGLLAWVVMPEHVHLLLEPPQSDTPLMSRFLRSLKQPVAQRLIADFRRRGVSLEPITTANGEPRVWQEGGGFDRNVRTIEELHREIAYIHHNPVERGLVKTPTDWEWSSARWCAGIRGPDAGWGGRIPIDTSRIDWGRVDP